MGTIIQAFPDGGSGGGGGNAEAMIASAFSTSSEYSAGDLVIYEGTLYKFTTDYGPGNWDPTKVTTTIVDDELQDKQTKILVTPLVINGDNETTVEGALGALNDTFTGTQNDWDTLTLSQKLQYKFANITNDSGVDETVVDTVQDGNMHAVTSNAVHDAIDNAISNLYTPSGSKTVAEMVSTLLVAGNLGNVYNMTTSGITTSDFVEGQGKTINVGDNVAIVNAGTSEDPSYKFDLLAGFVDITGKADKPSSSTSGNLASLDGNGNLADSGWKSDKTTTAVSGNPISISGLKSNQLAINPIITLEPIQAGSGDPSPSNIRAISGYDKIEVLSCGKNLLPLPINSIKAINTDGTWSGNVYTFANITFTFTLDDNNNAIKINVKGTASQLLAFTITTSFATSSECILNGTPSGGGESSYQLDVTGGSTYYNDTGSGVTIPSGLSEKTIRIRIAQGYAFPSNGLDFYPMIRSSNIADSTFEPYNPHQNLTLQFGQTIYGGTLDLKNGVLRVDKGYLDINAAWEAWTTNYYKVSIPVKSRGYILSNMYQSVDVLSSDGITSNYSYYVGSNPSIIIKDMDYTSDLSGWKTARSNLQVVYELATPYTIQLTPHEISLLKDYAYVSTNGTSIAFDYHNGEMASLGDVSQLGETVNELGNQVGELADISDIITFNNNVTEIKSKILKKQNDIIDIQLSIRVNASNATSTEIGSISKYFPQAIVRRMVYTSGLWVEVNLDTDGKLLIYSYGGALSSSGLLVDFMYLTSD